MGLYERDYGRDDSDLYGSSWQPMHEKPKSATIVLIVINVTIFFLDFLFGRGQIATTLATGPDTLFKPWLWWQFLSYGFVHDPNAIFHILFNMIGLFIFGRPVEQRLGFAEFIRFYLIAIVAGGVIASIAYWIRGEPASIIGASGAVVATTILFACYYPQLELLLFFVIPIKAWVLAAVFVGSDILGALGVFEAMEPTGNGAESVRTAFEVHLAGAAFAGLYFYQRLNFSWLSFDISVWRASLRNRSRRMKLRLHDPDRKIRQEEAEADRILAKIHQHGEASLTAAERRLLERYSRRQREKRRG